MNIVVCIKQVPDTTEVKINPQTGTLIREGVPSIMNPDDKGGLEFALQLKDKYGAHVTVITMGLPQAEAILREALAMGVDRAILLTDRKLGGADTLATSSAIAGALRTMDFDLIITGRQAIDGDTADCRTSRPAAGLLHGRPPVRRGYQDFHCPQADGRRLSDSADAGSLCRDRFGKCCAAPLHDR